MSAAQATTESRLLTVEETAKRLHVSPVTVYRRISAGQLPAVRLGERGPLRVDEHELWQWVFSESQSGGAAAAPPSPRRLRGEA